MDAQRGLSVSGHRNTVLCLHLTSDTYHVTPSGRAPRARGKFWIRRVKLRIFRPDPKSHKSEGFPAAQIFKTHKCQNTYCRSAHFSKAVKFVGAQNPRGTTWPSRWRRTFPTCADHQPGSRLGWGTRRARATPDGGAGLVWKHGDPKCYQRRRVAVGCRTSTKCQGEPLSGRARDGKYIGICIIH